VSASPHYLDSAFAAMLEVARRAGRHLNDRPLGEGTNTIAALAFHCTDVCEFWLGHVALGRPSARDRDAEFSRVLWLGELEEVVGVARARAASDLDALARGEGTPSDLRSLLPGGGTDESVVLHVLEELHQHLGHMESTLDALVHAGAPPERLFHLALREDWEAARREQRPYEVSTLGSSFAEVGFIHCSFEDQVARTAARHYAGRDVLLLEVDPAAVAPVLRVEDADGDRYPHLYAPLELDAVVRVEPYRTA